MSRSSWMGAMDALRRQGAVDSEVPDLDAGMCSGNVEPDGPGRRAPLTRVARNRGRISSPRRTTSTTRPMGWKGTE